MEFDYSKLSFDLSTIAANFSLNSNLPVVKEDYATMSFNAFASAMGDSWLGDNGKPDLFEHFLSAFKPFVGYYNIFDKSEKYSYLKKSSNNRIVDWKKFFAPYFLKPNGFIIEMHPTFVRLQVYRPFQVTLASGQVINVPFGSVNIPFKYFLYENITSLYRINVVSSNPSRDVFSFKGHYLVLLYFIALSPSLGLSKLTSLFARKYYVFNVDAQHSSLSFSLSLSTGHVTNAPINEEHFGVGYSSIDRRVNPFIEFTSPFCDDNSEFFCFEDPKKLNARVARLVNNSGINLGSFKVFVCDDVPLELKSFFNTGAVYVPNSFIERLGIVRVVSPFGIKGVTSPMPLDFITDLDGNSLPECFISSKGSWKGGLNTIYQAHTNLTLSQMSNIPSEDILDHFKQNLVSVKVGGHVVDGYFVNVPIYGTDFYNLFGLRNIESSSDSSDGSFCDYDGDVPVEGQYDPTEDETSSFFVRALNFLREDPSFDLIQHIVDALESKVARYVNHFVSVNMQDAMITSLSYGSDFSSDFLGRCLESGNNDRLEAFSEALFVDDGDISSYDGEAFMVALVGYFDSLSFGSVFQGRLSIDAFRAIWFGFDFDGYSFPGISNLSWWKLNLFGESFIFPSGKIMSYFIKRDDLVALDNGTYAATDFSFSGPLKDLMVLYFAYKKYINSNGSLINSNVDWRVNAIRHQTSLQRYLLGKNISSVNVPGSYYVALPGWWLNTDQVCLTTSPYNPLKHKKRLTYAKAPTLFHSSVCDVMLSSNLPIDIYGEISSKMRLALSKACFVNQDLLLSQANDCDGDLVRLTNTGGVLPIYSGQPLFTSSWVRSYVDGENDMKLSYKSVYKTSISDLREAVNASSLAKSSVGVMSSHLFYVEYVLTHMFSQGKISFDYASYIKEAYAMVLQDEAMRNIKSVPSGNRSLEEEGWYNFVSYKTILSNPDMAIRYIHSMVNNYIDNANIPLSVVTDFVVHYETLQTVVQNPIRKMSLTSLSKAKNPKKAFLNYFDSFFEGVRILGSNSSNVNTKSIGALTLFNMFQNSNIVNGFNSVPFPYSKDCIESSYTNIQSYNDYYRSFFDDEEFYSLYKASKYIIGSDIFSKYVSRSSFSLSSSYHSLISFLFTRYKASKQLTLDLGASVYSSLEEDDIQVAAPVNDNDMTNSTSSNVLEEIKYYLDLLNIVPLVNETNETKEPVKKPKTSSSTRKSKKTLDNSSSEQVQTTKTTKTKKTVNKSKDSKDLEDNNTSTSKPKRTRSTKSKKSDDLEISDVSKPVKTTRKPRKVKNSETSDSLDIQTSEVVESIDNKVTKKSSSRTKKTPIVNLDSDES